MKRNFVRILFLSAFLVATSTAQAQFLDKLTKKVEERVENTIIDKTSKKAEKETGKAVDNVLEGDSDKKTKKSNKKEKNKKSSNTNIIGGGSSSAALQTTYDFSYIYQIKMSTSQGDVLVDYYLKPKSNYLGSKMNQAGVDMFMIMEKNNMHMFMNTAGSKFVTTTSIDSQDVEGNSTSDYTFTSLPDRVFSGYTCKGTKMENSENEIIVYYTNEVPVSFQDVFGFESNQQNIPAALKEHFKDGALMMYMEYKDKTKKSKDLVTMECLKIEKTNFTFSTAGYQKL